MDDGDLACDSSTRYLYELGCSPAQMGFHMALPNIVDIFSQFLSSAIEARVHRSGMPRIKIHRYNVLVGASLQACALVTFGLANNRWVATTALCLNRLFSTGMSSWNSQV